MPACSIGACASAARIKRRNFYSRFRPFGLISIHMLVWSDMASRSFYYGRDEYSCDIKPQEYSRAFPYLVLVVGAGHWPRVEVELRIEVVSDVSSSLGGADSVPPPLVEELLRKPARLFGHFRRQHELFALWHDAAERHRDDVWNSSGHCLRFLFFTRQRRS